MIYKFPEGQKCIKLNQVEKVLFGQEEERSLFKVKVHQRKQPPTGQQIQGPIL